MIKFSSKAILSRAAATVLMSAAASLAPVASAATITFEGAPIGSFFGGAITEDGFNYSNFSGFLYANMFGNPNMDMEGEIAFGGGVLQIVSASAGLFTFAGLDYEAYHENFDLSQTLTVEGYLAGNLVGSVSYMQASTFGFALPTWDTYLAGTLAGISVDELRIGLAAGQNDGEFTQAVDNIQLSAARSSVPEPAAWAMMLLGFGLIGGAMRRRQSVRFSFAA